MDAHLKLKEIIWELTGRCENGCSYCGSKECWNEKIDEERIIKIAKEIAKFPPEEIDMSGGDPTLVSFDTHKKIVDILHVQGVKCKILMNPKSYKNNNSYVPPILGLYDWVGISINTEEELNIVKNNGNYSFFTSNKATIISNFNLENIFLFDDIKEYVKNFNSYGSGMVWQIQYTVYKDKNDKLALYNNDSANKHFFKMLDAAVAEGVKAIFADNINTGKCSAGLASIGILSDGTVVPCLSMRSWAKIDEVGQGNILALDHSLEEIWMTEFREQRFCKFLCCKDHCKNKAYTPKSSWWSIYDIKSIPEQDKGPCEPQKQIVYGVWPRRQEKTIPWPGEVYVYAVVAYAVDEGPKITMYAVFDPNIKGDSVTSSTYINDVTSKRSKKRNK